MAIVKFKIFVINLDSSQDRLVSIAQQFDKLGLEFERVSAVRGSDLSKQEKSEIFDLDINLQKYHKILNDGEIGCYLSHVRCYEKIIAEQLDYALILEDDAILTEHINGYIKNIPMISNDWDYIKLSHGSKVKKVIDTVSIGDNLSLSTAKKIPSTNTGQFVSLSGAEKLMAHAFPIARTIDVEIQYWFENQLRCFVALPSPILNGDFGSEINQVSDRREAKKHRLKRWVQKIHFELELIHHRNNIPSLPKIKR